MTSWNNKERMKSIDSFRFSKKKTLADLSFFSFFCSCLRHKQAKNEGEKKRANILPQNFKTTHPKRERKK